MSKDSKSPDDSGSVASRCSVAELRALLQEVLENDEASEGFNNANLDDELKHRIRDAIEQCR